MHKKHIHPNKNSNPRVCPICRKDGGPLPLLSAEENGGVAMTEIDGVHNMKGPVKNAKNGKSGATEPVYTGTCDFAGCYTPGAGPKMIGLDPDTHKIHLLNACGTHIGMIGAPEMGPDAGCTRFPLKNGGTIAPLTMQCNVLSEDGKPCTALACRIRSSGFINPEEVFQDTTLYENSEYYFGFKQVKIPLCVNHNIVYKHGVEMKKANGAIIYPSSYSGKKLNTHCMFRTGSGKGKSKTKSGVDFCLNVLDEMCQCKIKKHAVDIFKLPGEAKSVDGEGEDGGVEPKVKITKKVTKKSAAGSGGGSGAGGGSGGGESGSLLLAAVTPVDPSLCGAALKNGNGTCCLKGKPEFGGKCGRHKSA